MAPAPYHALYNAADVLPANRTEKEIAGAHPVIRAFMEHDEGQSFFEEDHRRHVIPTYMGLISQADHYLGELLTFLKAKGRLDDTLIVLTADHGSYLGDHWLGEKELFHEESVRIPMIIRHPSPEADGTRGTLDDRLVEAIDLLPTFVEAVGAPPAPSRLEGRSLLPLLCGETTEWRSAVFSEQDYSFMRARRLLGLQPSEARAYMIRTPRWKYVLFEKFRPQLFDLTADPKEQTDLGASPEYETVRHELHDALFTWLRGRKHRKNMTDAEVDRLTDTARQRGVFIEIW
jgi:arylsulfatase A-like enzyme